MQNRRAGFTLIELLIVIVIIGILAAIAIPKFGATREKAYFKSMASDLRNVAAQQEIFYSDPANAYTYANAAGDWQAPATLESVLGIVPSQGVTLTVVGEDTGWMATATHQALGEAWQTCTLYSGTVAAPPTGTQPGVVNCVETAPVTP